MSMGKFWGDYLQGALRGHLCSSSAFLFLRLLQFWSGKTERMDDWC